MKLPVIATILLVLAAPAHARMRHDRVCDIAQEKSEAMLFDQSGTAVMFGPCNSIKDIPPGERVNTLGGALGPLRCGYQAYRENKRLRANPYKNHELASSWSTGWKMARRSCTTGLPPSVSN